MKTKEPTTWSTMNIPSVIGSYLAQKVLKAIATMRESMMNKVVCHDVFTLALSFLYNTRPCTRADVCCAADGHPLTHPKALVHPVYTISSLKVVQASICRLLTHRRDS